MKNNGLLCGCLAMLMVGMGFSVKTVTPDQARLDIAGGKVKGVYILDSNGQDVGYREKLTEEGLSVFDEPAQITRDKMGRLSTLLIEENEVDEDGEPSTHSYEETYRYAGESLRPYMQVTSGESIYMGFGEGYSKYCHYIYSDSTANPVGDMIVETNYIGQPIMVYYCVYHYTEFDKFGNWTKRDVTTYHCDISFEEDEEDDVKIRPDLLELSVILCDKESDAAKYEKATSGLIKILTENLEPEHAIQSRVVVYYE